MIRPCISPHEDDDDNGDNDDDADEEDDDDLDEGGADKALILGRWLL